MAMSYQTIESSEASEQNNTPPPPKMHKRFRIVLITLATLATLAFLLLVWIQLNENEHNIMETLKTKPQSSTGIQMPGGVNFGSWLSLEDYFFAGEGAVEVATPDDGIVAKCLPPLHLGQGPMWQSETDLLRNMTRQTNLATALRVFHAYRVSFIDFDEDLATLAKLGIKHVRVPVSWCLTDHDPTHIDPSDTEKDLADKFTCRDQFVPGVQWPAVPKSLVEEFLRKCGEYGIGATLDVHTYPGATSIGTFSGLWPRWSRFWKFDEPNSKEDIGRGLLKEFVAWMESLAKEDPLAFKGFRAISPMNEPAHLAGLFGPGGVIPDKESFLPDLPLDMARVYLQELNPTAKGYTNVPNGPHLRVLMWLRDAVQTYRESSLPKQGKELHVNIHESIFRPNVLPPSEGDDSGGRHPGATRIIASWWRATTSPKERNTWAVLDMHHYHAWEPVCQGASDGPPKANYTCGNNPGRMDALKRCTSWADVYRKAMDEECGPGAKLASAEFSASTHHRVRHACNDIGTLRASYKAQVEAAQRAQVELFWWSYKMPYGGAFKNAWSFKHLMFLLGVMLHPDESNFDCGEHVMRESEPTDDVFSPDEKGWNDVT